MPLRISWPRAAAFAIFGIGIEIDAYGHWLIAIAVIPDLYFVADFAT